ncbi:LysR family transcriptional regulator [Solimonas flava]|uniref:LysR family transcriptional regulator n=1 Tax=Solimonas flava TaxID=415849 RepID=UPI00041619A3|nr:LysR family transcriptional regulator [Solimonas flava]
MQDLNDLYYYAQVVEHRGFAPAARALGLPKSTLSRRIGLLEARLGVRLIQRSTRRFSVTELGQTYYAHCKAMLVEADAAQESIELTRAEPRGIVRLACPIALLHAHVGAMLAEFMTQNPRVELHLEASNRRVDVVGEGVDIALRARHPPLEDSDLVIKTFGWRSQCIVASPSLLAACGTIAHPADLNQVPSLDLGPPRPDYSWRLEGPDGAQATIHHRPRMVSDDMIALRTAALAGVGVVQLPTLMVIDAIRNGTLLRPLPDWAPKRHIIHAVYSSKRGMLPAVRALLDHLGERFAQLVED